VHHAKSLSLHIVEWFVVPLAMYLLLFWWRDNLNILHMPLADLVALCDRRCCYCLEFFRTAGCAQIYARGRAAMDLFVERGEVNSLN
jgi:hypothetical protein